MSSTIPEQDVVPRLCAGEDPSRLGIRRLSNGLLDLRGIRLPSPRTTKTMSARGMNADYRMGKIVLPGCVLNSMDFSGSHMEESIWEDLSFSRVLFDNLRGRHVVFVRGSMKEVSFRRADLRNSHWGTAGKEGPTVVDANFTDADMRGATFNHPLFRGCRFVNTNLEQVNFRGSRFEDCVFAGLLDGALFRGSYPDPNPSVAHLSNPMSNVDFSKAELRFVGFSHGIDLTSCVFPKRGYARISHPREAFGRALQSVRSRWSGDARRKAEFYLETMLRGHFPVDQPFYVLRPRDLMDSPMGPDVARRLLSELGVPA